jgi:hypothetical protein
MVTVEPATVHTDDVVEEKVTAFPLDEVAEIPNGTSLRAFVAGGANVMDCAATPTTSCGDELEVVCAFAKVPLTPVPQHEADPSVPITHV